ncbi:Hcp family type VI secretion system effector [Chloroflexota bacterium]
MAIFLALMLGAGILFGSNGSNPAQASKQLTEPPKESESLSSDQLPDVIGLGGSIFAKYEGVDGESKDANHDKWIDVLSIDWGAHRPEGGATGQSRRRVSAIVEDMVITFAYDKSVPKLQEKCLKGEVIPKLEIELTANYGESWETYLKYEFKNVMITNFHDSASADGGPPIEVIGNNFEEVKVTYTEYDSEGNAKGNVEYNWEVEKGE